MKSTPVQIHCLRQRFLKQTSHIQQTNLKVSSPSTHADTQAASILSVQADAKVIIYFLHKLNSQNPMVT